ncbi:MAG: hypothetical protein FWG05_00265 [Kiritimatiellaeota bacterium]|nr:hypothetical protein [Kiritimatiellota bacterium]
MKKSVCLVALAAAVSHTSAQDAVNVPMSVDHRGLIEMPGVLRGGNDTHWGAANLIVFGPSWNYSAQDYALSNIKRSGNSTDMTLTGDLAVGGTAVRVEQESKTVKRADGSSALEMKWRMVHPENKPLGIQKAYIQFPLAVKDFGGAKVKADNGAETVLPLETGDIKPFYGTDGITIEGKNNEGKEVSLRITGKSLQFEFHDARKEGNPVTAYYVRLLVPGAKDAAAAEVTFAINASFLPFAHKEGADWVVFPFVNDVKPGSILDFSFINNDAPAGKNGRIVVDKDGHFAFEKTGKRVKFNGTNLCFDALFLEKEECDALAQQFRRQGYNAVRFHHIDVTLMKGYWYHWNEKFVPVEIDPAQLDKLDYMFAAMKKAGLYITFDFYCMGLVDVNGKGIRGELKSLVPIDAEVFNAWMKNVLIWMNHKNPYTGIAWKDDPAVINICPVNEDTIFSVWNDSKDRYNALFEEWKKTDKAAIAAAAAGRNDGQLLARFLTELKVASNLRIQKFFREQGIKALFSGANWFNNMPVTFERDTLDVVDHHQYGDHPWGPGNRNFNQRSAMRSDNPSYMIPNMMAPNRIFGKPFIVTEYNFCPPNKYRAEGGAMMGAYAALQDWDALYNFAWSHQHKTVRAQHNGIEGFDVATDPISILTSRQIALLYARGDVAPAKERHVYGVTMDEATAEGVGGMWGGGFFPNAFNALGLVSQIGSQVTEGGRKIQGKFNGVYTNKENLPDVNLANEIVSDTGELSLNIKQGHLRVNTPGTVCVAAPEKKALSAGPLAVRDATTFCSVSASSMDGKNVGESRRVLLFHITNVINTDMRFGDSSMMQKLANGGLPYLAKTGSVEVALKNTNAALKLYPLNADGTRMNAIPTTYANGAHTFTLAITAGAKNPTMMYELAP